MSTWLTNVRLEVGEQVSQVSEDGHIQTLTALFHLEVSEERIVQILPVSEVLPKVSVIDMAGKLALPAFKERHNHLDKTYLSLGLKACRPVSKLSSIHNQLIPIDTLRQQGVRVSVVGDGFYDSWNPNFSGDILEKVQQFCEYTGKSSERALRESLGPITQGIPPLDANGHQVWPVVGDGASYDFAEAS